MQHKIMKNMEIQVVSRQTVKPSSPTPQHLRVYHSPSLDKIVPIDIYAPVVFFYLSNAGSKVDPIERSSHLKKSLADCLTSFYPLAGRIREVDSVECNDEGAQYVEASVNCDLSEILQNPDVQGFYQLLPFEPCGGATPLEGKELVAVQISTFNCGGVAVGVCVSHKIADGDSVFNFLQHWANICRGCNQTSQTIRPSFDAASYFPPRQDLKHSGSLSLVDKARLVSKRFVFRNSDIDILKEKVSSDPVSEVKQPTRVEAVSAFLWKHFMAMKWRKSGPTKICVASHGVNLRQRMKLSKFLFGNIIWVASAKATIQEEIEYHVLCTRIRKAIREIEGDTLKKLQDGKSNFGSPLEEVLEQFPDSEKESLVFSSWCRFPLYEVDFGWGKPSWASCPCRFKNAIILTSTKQGDGIEALVTLSKDDMDIIVKQNPELLSFASSTI